MKCLLIRTPEKREFLTDLKNYPLLIEYANTFGGKLFTIEMPKPMQLCELPELAGELCEGDGIDSSVEYEIVKQHIPAVEKASKRKDEQRLAALIRRFIKDQLLKGKPLSLMMIRRHFNKYGLKTCTISNHYASIRRELTAAGNRIRRVGHGIYQCRPR
jgi:hypothetical protein